MFRYGTLTEFDPAAGKVRVTFTEDQDPDDNPVVSDWLPVIVPFAVADKTSLPLTINEQVCCMFDRELEDGVCLGAVMSDNVKPYTGASDKKFGVKFADGTLIEYNKATHELTANISNLAGKITLVAAEVNITGVVTITGAATVTGVLAVGGISPISPATAIPGTFKIAGDIETSGDVKAGTINLKTHKHLGVTTGGGTSLGPTP